MNALNGLLLVDKEKGMTSHDVVARARKILGLRAIGHAGTLDPDASGLLVLLLGEATKVSDYLLNGEKGYRVRVQLGLRSDSMDLDGTILERREVTCSAQEVADAALAMTGVIDLEVPVHSAVKVAGKRLYEYAHKGERPAEVPVKPMSFLRVEIRNQGADWIEVQLLSAKGAFVRAWANELGRRLGCGGLVSELRRDWSEPFRVEAAATLGEIESRWEGRDRRHGEALGSAWVPLKSALPHFREVSVRGPDAQLLTHGQISRGLQGELLRMVTIGVAMPPVRVISQDTDDLLAILVAQPGEFYKIRRVFHS